MKPHKHAELIKAWADGAEIEYRRLESWGMRDWELISDKLIFWYEDDVHEYRIKPEPKTEPKKVTLYIYNNLIDGKTWMQRHRVFVGHEGAHCTYMGQIEADYVEAKVRGEK